MSEPLGRRATKRLLDTAGRLARRARAAEPTVTDVVLLESQQAAYVQLHRRFKERASRGEGGVRSALEALDAMWETIRLLRGVALTVLQTLSTSEEQVQARRARFYEESTRLLEDAIRAVLAAAAGAVGRDVEIEFAVDLDPLRGRPAHLGFLQVRPMAVSTGEVAFPEGGLGAPNAVLTSTEALGNGHRTDICDVVYLRPDTFDPKYSPAVVLELERMNAALVAEGRPYLLIGFGRWGTSDPWRGVPVTWSGISGARVIAEVERAGMEVEHSQGSHFFHNLTSFGVLHFSILERRGDRVAWAWLGAQPLVRESRFVRHVRPARALEVFVEGRTRRGVVLSHDEA
jgi:hypothetical protein